MARIRRIVPALMVLIVVLLALGWFWLPTPDYQSLGTQSAYALTFISNIHYWRAAGYFDAAAYEKWLLHTWTLGVEFQFYLLLPIYLLVLNKIKAGTRTLLYGLFVAVLASLVLSLFVSSWKPVPAFYLLPTRGWEFGVGGLVFLIAKEFPYLLRYAKVYFFLGCGLLLASMLVINSDLAWPSGWALLPVLGTALIILAQQEQAVLTAHPIAQWLGERSYSIYLWHWPVVVVLYFVGVQESFLWLGCGIVLSLLLGHVSFKLIETPTRKGLVDFSFVKQIIVLAGVALVIGVAAVSARLFIFEGRLPPEVELIAFEENNYSPRQEACISVSDKTNKLVDCYYNDVELGVISIGDSHNSAIFTALGIAAKKHELNALHWAKSGCPTLKGAKFQFRAAGCYAFNNEAFTRLDAEFKDIPVILISRLTRALVGGNEDASVKGIPHIYFNEITKNGFSKKYQEEFYQSLIETSCSLSKKHKTYLMRPIPEMGVHVPNTMARNLIFQNKNADVKITLAEYHERHKFVWDIQDQAAEQCGVKILNPLPYLCDEEYCYGSKNGRPLYYDDDHLSEYGNKFLVPMFEEVFRDSP